MIPHNNVQQTAAYLKSLDSEFSLDSIDYDQSKDSNRIKQTLAIKILSIFGGLLSSAAFWGFLTTVGLYKSNTALAILGILAISAGVIIGKKYSVILWDTISVATFTIGFVMLGMSLYGFDIHDQVVAICFALLSLLCLCMVPNYIISFVSTMILNGSILAFILSTNRYDLIHIQVSFLAIVLSYSFLQEAKLLHKSFKIGLSFHAVRTGLLLCFLIGLGMLSEHKIFNLSNSWSWSTSAVCAIIILVLTAKLLIHFDISNVISKLGTYGLTLLVVIPTILYPGIIGAILTILLCFRVNYKTGFVMGVIAFLWFIGKFYYDLNYTLLTKSIMLFSSGVIFLFFYLFTYKRTHHEKI